MSELTIIWKDNKPYPITKINAYCLVLLLPTRVQRTKSGIIAREIPQHWERLTSDGHVIRCHTHVEAMEARSLMWQGVEEGQWLDIQIESYTPTREDLPYYEWVRGTRGAKMRQLGITEEDLPETQDPSLTKLSNEDWIKNGPR